MSDFASALQPLTEQLTRIADLLQRNLPPQPAQALQPEVIAYLWEYRPHAGVAQAQLTPVREPALIAFDDLRNVERQKTLIERNTRQFVQGRPANNVLLTGARGTGKSSLVKACLYAFHAEGLRLIEVDKEHLGDLPQIIELVRQRPERFILFCDDLSFEDGETGYKGLKTVLDGSVAGQAGNVLIYATSNRRHLLRETFRDRDGDEVHAADTVQEAVSLSDRFGISLTFLMPDKRRFLDIVAQIAADRHLEVERETLLAAAERWALERGARSPRYARQFVADAEARLARGESLL